MAWPRRVSLPSLAVFAGLGAGLIAGRSAVAQAGDAPSGVGQAAPSPHALTSSHAEDADDGAARGFGEPTHNAPATITAHRYTLSVYLAVADRIFPIPWPAALP